MKYETKRKNISNITRHDLFLKWAGEDAMQHQVYDIYTAADYSQTELPLGRIKLKKGVDIASVDWTSVKALYAVSDGED